jgi:hypothetical protein
VATGRSSPFGVTGSPYRPTDEDRGDATYDPPALSVDELRQWVDVIKGMNASEAIDHTTLVLRDIDEEHIDAILTLVTKPDNRGWIYLRSIGVIEEWEPVIR